MGSRFAALNPHSTLDFQLTSEGSISEYVGKQFISLSPYICSITYGAPCRHDYCKIFSVVYSNIIYFLNLNRHTRLTGKIQTW